MIMSISGRRAMRSVLIALGACLATAASAQEPAPSPRPGVNADRVAPAYPVPYGRPATEDVVKVLDRVLGYLESNTPTRLVDRESRQEVTDLSKVAEGAVIERGAFQLISYEWGVTYSGMLLAAEATGNQRFADYSARRLKFIAELARYYKKEPEAEGREGRRRYSPLRSVMEPRSLDDSGSMCAAMIKTQRAGLAELRPLIDNYMGYISDKQFRFKDGTLARNRPHPDTLWLDDLYMSVPALAQMGRLTGEKRYYDDAVKQILQFSERMFVKEKGIYMHGWVTKMDPHPVFHWARANGWAIMAMTELLEVLPDDHPGRAAVLAQYRAHARGLAACQGGKGLWYQLLDRNDSYLETSASAMFVYGIARGINRGWLDPHVYGPMAVLGWNAVTTKVNAEGAVEDTCVGTGMGFEPTFYYYRPTSIFAAHGYGPVLLAGAEMIKLVKALDPVINDGAMQTGGRPAPRP
jgi:unsaturated rhamnogalacturonyl hydrolase